MTALTRVEATARAQLLRVRRYVIDLDLTCGDVVFGSSTLVEFDCGSPGAATFVELEASLLRSVELNGRPLDISLLEGNRFPLSGLQPTNQLRVVADMPYSVTGEGMHRFVDPEDGEVYVGAYCGMATTQQIFAAFDQPDLKAEMALRVTAPPEWTLIANGIAHTTGSVRGRWEFACTPPLPTYLFALVAGPWHSILTHHRGIPMGLHCRRSLAEHLEKDAAELFAVTRACFDRYSELFDEPYPFDSYDQAFVPELNWGAMETPGCITFRDELVFRSAVTETQRQLRAVIVAHEMAHMWFGDLVTMRWWDDIWLNESFAEYMGFQVLAETTRFSTTWVDFAIETKAWGYDADQRPSTHPVAPRADDVPDTDAAMGNFDGISYAKGAAVLRQLVAWLGEGAFFAGINQHLARHRFANATLADLIGSLAEASGRDVHTWAGLWLGTTGVDALGVSVERPTGRSGVRLVVTQLGPAPHRPHQLSVGLYDHAPGNAGRLVLRSRMPLELNSVRGTLTLPPDAPPPDLVLINDGDLGYCKLRYDARSSSTVTTALSGIDDPLNRAVLWTAARHHVADGDLPPGEYLDLVERHLPGETDTSVIAGVLRFAREHVVCRYLDPADQPSALTALSSVCETLLRRGQQTGSGGVQLAALHGLVESSITDQQVDDLARWLEVGAVAGVTLDPDLRWRMLRRLASLGRLAAAVIDRELEQDRSSSGREGGARCRAALPGTSAKEAAWAAMFTTSAPEPGAPLSSSLLAATAQGFWQASQYQLLEPFAAAYFPAVVAESAVRGAAIAEVLGREGFPRYAVDVHTVQQAERCLRDDRPIPALRRRLTDQLDDLRRAVRVREAAARS
jgi:aminopeptidase N